MPIDGAVNAINVPSRQCGRCRGIFDGDPTLDPTGMPDWWICPPCKEVLLGAGGHGPRSGAGRPAQ